MSDTKNQSPTLEQFVEAFTTVRDNNFADITSSVVQDVLKYGVQRGYYTRSFAAVLAGKAGDDDRRYVLNMLHAFVARKRVDGIFTMMSDSGAAQARLAKLLLATEPTLRCIATDTPFRSYELQNVARDLKLGEKSTVSDVLAALVAPDALELLQSRAANDYWRLRIVLAASTQNTYYWREFPLSESHIRMGIYTVRRTLQAPWKSLCAEDKDQKPSLLARVTSGAFLFAAADDETLVPNPLLADDADRAFITYDPHIKVEYIRAGAGPYMTRAEADAYGAAWESYADTVGGASVTADVRTWTRPTN